MSGFANGTDAKQRGEPQQSSRSEPGPEPGRHPCEHDEPRRTSDHHAKEELNGSGREVEQRSGCCCHEDGRPGDNREWVGGRRHQACAVSRSCAEHLYRSLSPKPDAPGVSQRADPHPGEHAYTRKTQR